MGHALMEQQVDETRVADQSGRPDGGAIMPPWKHYRPAPTVRVASEA